MTFPDLQARVRRLDALALGLMREAQDPPLYVERRDYIHAMRLTVEGLEIARVALASAVQRLEP